MQRSTLWGLCDDWRHSCNPIDSSFETANIPDTEAAPPNPCCHGLESKRVPLSTHFTTLWVGDRPAPFLACFSLPLLRTMSLLVDWHTYVLLPIDLFFQEKHYKTIFHINIKTSVPSTVVCPLRSAHTSRHCLCVQRNHL